MMKRNCLLFFQDRAMVLTAMVAPMILVVLYLTFLSDIYRDTLTSALAPYGAVETEVLEGWIGGWIFSCLLAVSCTTTAFTCTQVMAEDKIQGMEKDFALTVLPKSMRMLSYFVSSALGTCIIQLAVLLLGFFYLAVQGWYLSGPDMAALILDVCLLSLFGTALSLCIQVCLKTNGQMKAASTLVCSLYGFLCGAYMPIAQFSGTIQTVLSFLPSTYGASLLHLHFTRQAYAAMEEQVPAQVIDELKKAFDTQLSLSNHVLGQGAMYGIVLSGILLFCFLFIALSGKRPELSSSKGIVKRKAC